MIAPIRSSHDRKPIIYSTRQEKEKTNEVRRSNLSRIDDLSTAGNEHKRIKIKSDGRNKNVVVIVLEGNTECSRNRNAADHQRRA